jgi:hypothetical protein
MLKVYKNFRTARPQAQSEAGQHRLEDAPRGPVWTTPMWRTSTLFLAAFESNALLVVSLGWLVQ